MFNWLFCQNCLTQLTNCSNRFLFNCCWPVDFCLTGFLFNCSVQFVMFNFDSFNWHGRVSNVYAFLAEHRFFLDTVEHKMAYCLHKIVRRVKKYWCRPHPLGQSLFPFSPQFVDSAPSEMFVAFTANEVVGPNCHSVRSVVGGRGRREEMGT